MTRRPRILTVLGHPALLALVAELLAAWTLWAVAHAVYGTQPTLDPSAVSPLWLGALALGGVVGGGLALRGLHRLHRTRAPLAATVVTGLVYAPLLLVAVAQTYILLLLAFRL
ncbi:MAG: hypothetical protein JNM10_05695 [Planctomycetia bacterium]|nr:hypothetical protein [Planctomycetia bacterium]